MQTHQFWAAAVNMFKDVSLIIGIMVTIVVLVVGTYVVIHPDLIAAFFPGQAVTLD